MRRLFFKIDKMLLKKSFWGALGRLIGVMMGAGAGSLLYQMIGNASTLSIGVASFLSIGGFLLIWVSEYEKSK